MRYLFALGIVFVVYMAYASAESCVQCNSASDPKCATNPEQFMAKQCANATSMCYTRVLNGNTIRGCASDLNNTTASNCNNAMECLICSFMEGCNRAVFPQHRVSCLQCISHINGTCATDIRAMPTVCPLYDLADKCYIRSTGKNDTNSFQRGCLSSAKSVGQCKSASECYTCEGAGCNFLEANSTYIPTARDSAMAFGASFAFVLMASLIAKIC